MKPNISQVTTSDKFGNHSDIILIGRLETNTTNYRQIFIFGHLETINEIETAVAEHQQIQVHQLLLSALFW